MEEDNLICEFGGEAKFLSSENVSMCDGDGNIMLCKCGKKATQGVFGIDSYIALCSECVWPEKK